MQILYNDNRFKSPLIFRLIEEDIFVDPVFIDKILRIPREILIEDLSSLFEYSIDFFQKESIYEEVDNDFIFHFLFILHELNDDKTFGLLIQFMDCKEDYYDFYIGDYLTERFWEHVLPFVRRHLDELIEFAIDDKKYVYMRTAVITAIAQTTFHSPELRPQIIEALERIINHFLSLKGEQKISENETGILELLLGDLIAINAKELAEKIKLLFKANYDIIGMAGSWKNVKQILETGEYGFKNELLNSIADRYEYLIDFIVGDEDEDEDEYDEENDYEDKVNLPTDLALIQSKRDLQRIQEHLAQQNFSSVEEMTEYVKKYVNGKRIPDIIGKKEVLTNREKAEELIDRAKAQETEVAKFLLEEALETDPLNMEAMLEMGKLNLSPDENLKWFKMVIEIAKKEFGEEYFTENKGNFWQIHETRPFIEAKYHLAGMYDSMNRLNDAICELKEIIDLNSNDNLGARENLAVLYLKENRYEDFRKLRKQFPDEDKFQALPAYLYAIYLYKTAGPVQNFKDAIKRAVKLNPNVLLFLTGKKQAPKFLPNSYTMGDENEAIICIDNIIDLIKENPEIIKHMMTAKNKVL